MTEAMIENAPPSPLVSVVIPAFNAAATLPLQLEALVQQVDAPPFEVVVVDNRSTDDLVGAVDEFRTRLSLNVVDAYAYQGSSYARNVGIAAARAPWIMFCDADDVVSSQWLTRGVQAFEVTEMWTGTVVHLTPEEFAEGLGPIRLRLDDVDEGDPGPQPVDPLFPILMGGNFGASRDVLVSLGGFDQSFPHAGDDNDLGFRAAREAVGLIHLPGARVASRGKPDQRSVRRMQFRAARAHAVLADRYGVWDASRARGWKTEPLRCVGAAIKMAAHPRSSDWAGLASRSMMAAGTAVGAIETRVLRHRPESRIGTGLTASSSPSTQERPLSTSSPESSNVGISVIIPAYNAATFIPEQLESLAAQERADEFEIIIADNGSTDGTAGVAMQTGQRLGLDVRVVDASGVASASHARNVGARAARAEILLFCDADDFVASQWVAELSAAVRSRDDAVAVGRLLHHRFNDEAMLTAYDIPSEMDVSTSNEPGYPVVEGGFAGHLPTVAGNNFGVRRSLYLQVGGMDPTFPGGSEETDFSWRAQNAGAVVVHAPQAIVHYRLRTTPEAVFRQQRIQQLARMLLWVRHRDAGMAGPSWKASAIEVVRHLPAYWVSRGRADRLRHARIAGGHVGALQGMLRYRVFRRVPARDLMATGDVGSSSS